MPTTLVIPGLNSSGEDHWQTWFEEKIPETLRVIQKDWSVSDLSGWSARILNVINRTPGRLYLVAHSFGVLASVVAAHQAPERIGGVFLVAPADPKKFEVSENLPRSVLPFPSLVVGSTSDSWMRLSDAAEWADIWGADFVNLGDVGHVNPDSGFGPWPEGLALFQKLRGQSEIRRRAVLSDDLYLRPYRTPKVLHKGSAPSFSITPNLQREIPNQKSDVLHVEIL